MMQRVLSRCAQNDRGATAVEFAIILPVLLLFVFGIIEWGLYMYNRQVITNAAREGARYGVLMRATPRNVNDADEDPAIKASVLGFADTFLVTFGSDKLIADNINVFRGEPPYDPYNPPVNPFGFETKLTVTFDYQYNFLFLSNFGIGPLEITGASAMRME